MANKNSTYVGSLVSFLNDTKPYHSKLTEVVEEYRFGDDMTVNITDKMFSTVMAKAAWMYTHFADGQSVPAPQTLIHQLVSPQFRNFSKNNTNFSRGAFKFARDEINELGPLWTFVSSSVPSSPSLSDLWYNTLVNKTFKWSGSAWVEAETPLLSYDAKNIQGVGLADAFVQRGGDPARNEALLEGHDVFLSHGARVFQIKQTISTQPIVTGRYNHEFTSADAPFPKTINLAFDFDSLIITGPAVEVDLNTISVTGVGVVKVTGLSNAANYQPQFTDKQDDNLISQVTLETQANALDLTNPNSSINRVQAIIDQMRAHLILYPNSVASTELDALQEIIDAVSLPSSYEGLINALENGSTPVLNGYSTWAEVHGYLSSLSPALYFNEYTDLSQRQSGALRYDDVVRDDVVIKNIVPNIDRPDYEEWILEAATSSSFFVRGSASGLIGSVNVPGAFTSSQVSFTTEAGTDPIVVGSKIIITPAEEITIHGLAPLETWSIIKVNPLAYSRPVLSSTRYGYLMSGSGEQNMITILDASFPTCTVILTATSSTTFSVSVTAEPNYSGVATVNQVYNDGRIQFTIVAGSTSTFQIGDIFYIDIINDAPAVSDLDLYYGFDLDPYDGDTYLYDAVGSTPEFNVPLNFAWDSRFTSYDFVSFGLVISQNAVTGRQWRLRAIPNVTKPLPQRPAADNRVDQTNGEGSPLYDADSDGSADIRLYYADYFNLEYYNTSINDWTSVSIVAVGSTYINAIHGLTFNLIQPATPFIGAVVTNNAVQTQGGDVIYWVIKNNPPMQTGPASLVSPRSPRLIIHGDSYHFTPAVKWTLSWLSNNTYNIQGYYTEGVQAGTQVLNSPIIVNTDTQGKSYWNKEYGIHWTVVPGISGLDSGDKFTLETYSRKPMYLVHGSVSGWQADAETDKWYWNGKIGFKITQPSAEMYEGTGENISTIIEGSPWITTLGTFTLEEIRPDIESCIYTIRCVNDGWWMLYKDGKIVAAGDAVLQDQYIKLSVPTAIAGAEYTISIDTEFQFTFGHDLAIVRTTAGRAPLSDDFVLFCRTKKDDVVISIKAVDANHALTLAELAPTTIDLRFVDLSTGSGVPLSATSPETAVLQGWIPTFTTVLDGETSVAEFSDSGTQFQITAAATTGEKIGTIFSLGATPAEPVVFKWDSDFAAKYLILNTEAVLVTLGSGINEQVRVNIRDRAIFLISGGGLDEDSMFSDVISIVLAEDNQWTIRNEYAAAIGVQVQDGPFGGFLPGYDNTLFDEEDGANGYYDAGQALTSYFQRAKELALKNVLTPEEQAEYNDLLGLIGDYVSDPASTTLDQFLTALDADPPINYAPTTGFGVPVLGKAIQVDEKIANAVGTQFGELVMLTSLDHGYTFDDYGYDVGTLDAYENSEVIAFSSTLPPLPATGLPGSGVTYNDFITPLTITGQGGRVIEVAFSSNVVITPQFYIWYPSENAPLLVPVVERLSNKQFRFSIPAASELKLIIA